MYIDVKITNPTAPAVSAFTFTKKDEAGVLIGTVDSYSSADYRLEESFDKLNIYVQLKNSPKFLWPPKASYPISRIIFVDDTQVLPISM